MPVASPLQASEPSQEFAFLLLVRISFWFIRLHSDGIRELGTLGHTLTFRM